MPLRVNKWIFTFCIILFSGCLLLYFQIIDKQTGGNNNFKIRPEHEMRLMYLEEQIKELNKEKKIKLVNQNRSHSTVEEKSINTAEIVGDEAEIRVDKENNRNREQLLDHTKFSKVEDTTVNRLFSESKEALISKIGNIQDEKWKRSPLNDIEKYPCLSGRSTTTLRSNNLCVRTVNTDLLSSDVSELECVKMQLNVQIDICIHDPRRDRIVSAFLFATRSWEGQLVDNFTKALDLYNVTDVLDIGCNLGVYTIAAANSGRHVLSIDANVENLRLLSKSLTLNKMTNKVKLIWNAISNEYTTVSLSTSYMNVGANFVSRISNTSIGNDLIVETIKLDDIESLFSQKNIGMKMDIEGSELNALIGGIKFMKKVNIKFIQMEIGHHIKKDSGRKIVALLNFFGFIPYRSCLGDMEQTNIPINQWPFDVCFIKGH